MERRSLLAAAGTLAVGAVPGCTDTLFGDGSSGVVDGSQLTAQKGAVVDRYEEALTERNVGVRTQEKAIAAFNEEAYERSIGRFETSISHFETATEGFSAAADIAREIGEGEAASICETAEEEAGLQLEATQAGLDAAIAARDGSGAGDVNGHVEEYRSSVEAADALDVADPQALADVLQSG